MAKLLSLDQAGLLTWFKYLGPVRRDSAPYDFFLSWEDGILAVLKACGVNVGSTLLFPAFYCVDVLRTLERHGYRCAAYECHEDFRPVEASVFSSLQSTGSRVLVLYHAWGMSLAADFILPPDVIVVEDRAHSLFEASQVVIKGPNHFVLDSLRKVSPFQGSRVFSAHRLRGESAWQYRLRLLGLYLAYRSLIGLARFFSARWLLACADYFFDRYTELVGTSGVAVRGFWWDREFARRVDVPRVRRDRMGKAELAHAECRALSGRSRLFSAVDIPELELGRLRSYPVVLTRPELSEEILDFFAAHGVFLDFMFPDCTFCRSRRYLAVPLGPGIEANDIKKIFALFEEYEEPSR